MIRKHLLSTSAIVFAALSLIASFALRFDFTLPPSESHTLFTALCIFITVKGLAFSIAGPHRRFWSHIGIADLLHVGEACAIASAVACAVTWLIVGPSFPPSAYVTDAMIFFRLMAGLLISRRVYQELTVSRVIRPPHRNTVLIYGAGAAGIKLVKEIRSNQKLHTRCVGFLDDAPRKKGASLAGIRVLGTGGDAPAIVLRQNRRGSPISEIIIAMPSATGRAMQEVIANCRAAGVPFRTMPSFAELLEGKILARQLREVSVNDLLGRDPVRVAEGAIGEHITGKNVMVTGGCGSIGSELCRQLARFGPRRLVIFDQAESEMFMLALELRERFPSLDLAPEIGDICRYQRVHDAISRNSVEAVFHAAAYKHVPLMETHVIEAAENNVIGTYNVARAAHANQVATFLMISSDKAVNPTSIMGVTKRIGEIIVSAMPIMGGPRYGAFVSVRFGNVLASNGSVVTVFNRQIAAGGPVTVTHPDMRRYFMSIPEAVQLVLQAFSMGKGGEIFVLDMGEPVRITELARNMIRLAGLEPDEDIKIKHTGLRPGEKLFEELSMDTEDMLPTYHEKIKIFRSAGAVQYPIATWLEQLAMLVRAGDVEQVKSHLLQLVPEYTGAAETQANIGSEPVKLKWAHG
jgi:FlaA1/EpsC-like NDP-sugar epimerase